MMLYNEDGTEHEDSGKADITICIDDGGNVSRVIAPPGLSVLSLYYDSVMCATDGVAIDENGINCKPVWEKEPGEANADEVCDSVRGLLREALNHQARSFETSDHVNGANMVEWFAEWRSRVAAALAAAPWEGAGPDLAFLRNLFHFVSMHSGTKNPYLTEPGKTLAKMIADLEQRADVSADISKTYNVEARAERCLLVMLGSAEQYPNNQITEKDQALLLDASGWGGSDDPMDREQLSTWPAVWFKKEPGEVTGVFIACTDEDATPEDPAAFMAGASPALRNLWRDARAAGFTRIELTWG